jgi:hypothetical protein
VNAIELKTSSRKINCFLFVGKKNKLVHIMLKPNGKQFHSITFAKLVTRELSISGDFGYLLKI